MSARTKGVRKGKPLCQVFAEEAHVSKQVKVLDLSVAPIPLITASIFWGGNGDYITSSWGPKMKQTPQEWFNDLLEKARSITHEAG